MTAIILFHDIDYFSDLGQHTFNGAPDDTPPTIISVTATSETSVEVVFSEPINEDTANNVLNYQIENSYQNFILSKKSERKSLS